MEWLLKPSILFVIAVLGMFSHFLKKKVKGESITEIAHYFKDNFKSTFLALVATCVSYAFYMTTLSTGMTADFLTIFGLGYMCDSMFNKYEASE